MAIDGWVVRTRQPYHNEVENISCLRNRKVFLVLLPWQALMQNANFKCLVLKALDQLMMQLLGNLQIYITKLPPEYYFIGDEAFTYKLSILSPWPGRNLSLYEDSFNY
jgi:hypothetical protein